MGGEQGSVTELITTLYYEATRFFTARVALRLWVVMDYSPGSRYPHKQITEYQTAGGTDTS